MNCNPSSYTWASSDVPVAPYTSSSGSWCGTLLFIFLLAVSLWWICSGPKAKVPILIDEVVKRDQIVLGETACRAVAREGLPYGDARATVPLSAGAPMVASVGGLNLPGNASTGSALSGAFDMTEPGQEYMAAYNPTGLASVMPAGWRAGGLDAKAPSNDAYAEFSRYSITPEAVARSENVRSALRLSENTRQGMGRTLGYQSLLRNYVTPVGPQPIGDKSMLFNDSSVRQSYIASVTGAFPDLGQC